MSKTKRIKIVGIPNEQPDVRLYVLALIALARQLQEDEEHTPGATVQPPSEEKNA